MPEPKILVCADLHLGRSSAWIDGPDEVDRSAVGAWRRIVDHAIAGQATAVAIAGDVFDGKEAYYETRLAFRDGLTRLSAAGIPVVAVAGNHDWDSLPAFVRQYPDSLTLLGAGGRWDSHSVGGVTFLGWSFPTPTYATRAFETFRRPVCSEPVVGVLHGDLAPGSAYHPITTLDVASGADAWVLGHIHRFGRIGSLAIYPGSPQALDFGPGELGLHGFAWLTFEAGRPTFSEVVPISTVAFHDWQPDEITVADGEDAAEALERAAREFCDELVRTHVGVESVQLRVRALLFGCKGKPHTLPTSPDPRYSWHFLDVWIRDDRDPWEEAAGADAAAEVARLLIGALAVDGLYKDREVDEEWVREANTLVEQCSKDADSYWRRTVGQAVDHFGENAMSAPAQAEALSIARQAVAGELWEMLRDAKSRNEEVAA